MNPWNKLRRWLRGPTEPLRARRPGRARLAIEILEDRLVPSGVAAPAAQGDSSDFRGIINLPAAVASYPYRGDGYSVAILDTGVNYNLSDLGGGWGHRVVAGWNFVNNTSDPMDDNGHGTFVAGEIASSSSLFPGVAPDVNLIALKVLDASNTGTWANIDAGLKWVIAHRAQYHIVAVNLSLGSGNYTTDSFNLLETEFAALKNAGVFSAVASGNNFATGNSVPGLAYPAVDPDVVSVGATWAGSYGSVTFFGATDTTTAPNQLAGFTQRDSALSLVAPGAWITSDALNGGYTQFGGTSMSAAIVTGASVLVHQALDAQGLSSNANQPYILHLMQSTGMAITDNNTHSSVIPTGLTFRQLDLKSTLDAVPRPLTFTAIADQAIVPGGSAVVPLSASDPNGAAITFSAHIVNLPALAYQIDQQLGLSTTGSYYLNKAGYNEEWLIDKNLQWYWIMPNGEFRRYGGSASAALQPANLVATFDPSYYADPRKIWYAPYAAFAPLNLTIAGNQLTVKSTSSTWTGSAVIDIAATDGTFTVDHAFTLNVGSAPPAPPVIGTLSNLTVTHAQHPLVETLSATDPAGRPVTFTARIGAVGGQTPPVTVAVSGTQLTLTPALSFVGTYTVAVTASDGLASATTSFTVTVTNATPQLGAVAAQTMAAGQTSITVPLSATDADGDTLTLTASVQIPSASAYQLEQQLGLRQYGTSYYTNTWGANEKWLIGANNVWYTILPSGQLYRWAGTFAATIQSSNLVATLDPLFWTEPRLLWGAQPPVAPAITWTAQGNQLTLQRSASLTGVFVVQVAAGDGAATSAPRTFLLTLN
jgi:Subtilase family/Bacterial Ig domain